MLLKILVSLYLKQACKLYDIYQELIIIGMHVVEWKKKPGLIYKAILGQDKSILGQMGKCQKS